jgi:hypothetical protein
MKNRKIVMQKGLKGFAGHTNCGMDKKPESLSAREIAVMRKILMHNLGLIRMAGIKGLTGFRRIG